MPEAVVQRDMKTIGAYPSSSRSKARSGRKRQKAQAQPQPGGGGQLPQQGVAPPGLPHSMGLGGCG
eukprot:6490735-Prymnesium_polylepis.1